MQRQVHKEFPRTIQSYFKLISFLFAICRFQVAEQGVFFDYQKENRFNRLFATVMALMIFPFLALSSNTYSYYEPDYSLYCLFDFYGGGFFQAIVSTTPLILYVVFLRNLHERFVALNGILRFIIPN